MVQDSVQSVRRAQLSKSLALMSRVKLQRPVLIKKLLKAAHSQRHASHEAVIGKGLAKIVSATIGSEIVIVSQGADGSIANDVYKIVGIVESGDDITDRVGCYLHIDDAQELLVLEASVSMRLL